MHDHELELIAALAEGRLEDEAEARALIASSDEHLAEFEAQKLAFESLSGLGSATMTETEKAALHRDLWTELRTAPETSPSKRVPWYYRWAPAAAGMFVVVGLVAVVTQGGSFDQSEVATGPTFVTTTAADAVTAQGGSDGEAADSADDESAEAPEADQGADTVQEEGTVDFARALTPSGEAYYAATAQKIRDSAEDDPALADFEGEASSTRLQECVDESGLNGYEVLGAHPSPVVTDSEEPAPESAVPFIAAIPEGSDLSTTPIAFVDLFSCELIYEDQ